MSINRVDIQGTFIRQDASQLKVDADNKANGDLARLATQFEQENEENHIALTEVEEMEARDEKFDASQEGKNKYLKGNRQKKKEKKKDEDELLPDPKGVLIGRNGKPLYGAKRSSYDFKV